MNALPATESFAAIDIAGETMSCFLAMPKKLPAPAIVVLQEVFGVNDDMKESCRELAQQGYIALCPDLFWRQEPGLSLSHWTEEEWQKGLSLYEAYDRDLGARDIAQVLEFARALDGATGRVGLMGFCLGGLMTFLVTARTGSDASAAYYPGSAELYLAEGSEIAGPMIIHVAEEDEFIPKAAQASIRNAFTGMPHVSVYSYAGCRHAFARHSGTHYDAVAAKRANGRTLAFFEAWLK